MGKTDELRLTRKRAHAKSVEATPSDMAAFLADLFGQALMAEMFGVDRSTVSRWLKDGRIAPANQEQIQAVFYLAAVLLEHSSNYTTRSWFIGMNPLLDDQTPTEVLSGGNKDSWRKVLDAAYSFAEPADN